MRGRPVKPLEEKIREGVRIREDRINREAPIPPSGEVKPPFNLSPAEAIIWSATLEVAARGQIKPLDGALFYRYCWLLAQLIGAIREHQAWCDKPDKRPGETNTLRIAENQLLGRHPILGVIDTLMKQISQAESKLGLTPVDRERIRASAQEKLPFGDDWDALETPSDAVTQ